MLSEFVGSVSFEAALVLVFMFSGLTIMITSRIVTRRNRTDISNDFELAKMKLENEKEVDLYRFQTDRNYKFKQLDQNLITSHQVGGGGGDGEG